MSLRQIDEFNVTDPSGKAHRLIEFQEMLNDGKVPGLKVLRLLDGTPVNRDKDGTLRATLDIFDGEVVLTRIEGL